MSFANRTHVAWMTAGLAAGLLLMGALRLSVTHPNFLTPLAGLATPGYVLVTVFFTVLMTRAGVPFNRFGFGSRPGLRQLVLAIAAIILLRVIAVAVAPILEELLGARDLERFANVEGSTSSLISLLALSWTFAAFGEEFAYRIVLMRGIAYAFGDTRATLIGALFLQAVLFGLVHAYQGPAGVIGATISGIVFGSVTLLARWSIWPAALAHGTNNTIGIVMLYSGAAD